MSLLPDNAVIYSKILKNCIWAKLLSALAITARSDHKTSNNHIDHKMISSFIGMCFSGVHGLMALDI